MLLRDIERRFFSLFKPSDITHDKRVVTNFRHLNTRITKNNLAYLLVKDMFTTLGNSKCEVLSVLDLKDAFHSLRAFTCTVYVAAITALYHQFLLIFTWT